MASDPWLGAVLRSSSQETYQIQSKLGEGAFGAVYAAIEQPSNRKVAVKLLHAKHAQSQALTARFLQEEQIASRLEHPDAVQFYASGEAPDGTLWLAMEFVPGEPLDEYLRRKGPLSIKEALTILGPICEVLDEAHKKGIIHRDLKPQNMMVVELGRRLVVKLLDFGIAKFTEGSSQSITNTTMGTPMYMPPEQWESAKKVTPASDIYALGMIAYQCLAGVLPFQADSIPSWIKAHTTAPPNPLSLATNGRLPPALCDVVMQAIEKDPEVRFSSALALKNALEEAAKDASPSPAASTPNPKEQKISTLPPIKSPEASKRRIIVWGGLAGIALLVGFVSIPTSKTSPAPSEAPSQPTMTPTPPIEAMSIKPAEPCKPQLRFTLPDKSTHTSGSDKELSYKDGDEILISLSLLEQTSTRYITLLNIKQDGSLSVFSPSKDLPQIALAPGERVELPEALNKPAQPNVVIRARTKNKEGGEGLLALVGEKPEESLSALTPPTSGAPADVQAALLTWRQAHGLNSLCEVYQYYSITK